MRSFAASVSVLLSVMLGALSPAQQREIPDATTRRLGAIEFVGNKVFDQATLLGQLRMVRVGAPYVPAQLEADVELNLKGFLKEKGYMLCETSWEERVQADGSVGVRIKVAEGLQYRLSKLEIKGAKVFTAEELTAQIRLQPGDVLNFAEVKRGLERIKTMYMDKGYVNFSYIPDHQIHTDSRTMDLTFTIQEDLRFRVAYIGIVGCGEQEEEDKVRALLVLKPGDFFSYSALDSSVTAINKSGLYREIKESDYTIAPLDEKPGLLSVVFYLTPNTPRP